MDPIGNGRLLGMVGKLRAFGCSLIILSVIDGMLEDGGYGVISARDVNTQSMVEQVVA